ncbi:Arc family DNA-binding protein [Novosphingobium sp.]|uniref:Arc family DNA-binding protein n=1 Tax=Novosphingobium sp. TaxID=1874826 RepID=UPI002613EFF7|nr:Arc family DNA-binding protein [Novosphingobium sp.]
MDTILIRVPDGMKNKIAMRARANNRSMSGEVLDILQREMGQARTERIRELEALCEELEQQLASLFAQQSITRDRLESAREELMRRKLVVSIDEPGAPSGDT